MNIAYCLGKGISDARPKSRQATDFDQFVDQILSLPRAATKAARAYICGPLRPNGAADLRRCREDLLPRLWLALDLDGGVRDEVEIMLMRLPDYRAVAWQTARWTEECPRWRIVVHLDREVDRAEGKRLGDAFVRVLGFGLPSLRWDSSTHNGQQACFLPMAGSEITNYNGDPVDVDAVLALAPEEPSLERPATPDPYRALIIERGLFLRQMEAGMDAITCPFSREHTPEPPGSRIGTDTSTVYLRPLHGGYRWGRIHCKHEHCRKREQDDYIRKMKAEPRDVWRGQAGTAHDELPPVESYTDEAGARVTTGGAQAHTAPPFITAAALWNMRHEPTRWAVPGILPEGVTILGGKPKTGKSWFALDLALAVGDGGTALKQIRVTQGNCLYLALEDTKRRLTKRLRILRRAVEPSALVEFVTECARLGSGGEDFLRRWLGAHPGARLVVIDTLARFRRPANARDSSYATDYAVGQFLTSLCMEHQVAILVIHHLRKMESEDPIDLISGTLGLVGGVDGYLVLRRQPLTDAATLHVAGRDIEAETELTLAWDRDSARWGLSGEDPRFTHLTPDQRRVVEVLRSGPKTMGEIVAGVNPGHVVSEARRDPRYKAVAEVIYRLRDKQIVEQAPDRRWALSTHTHGTDGTYGTDGTHGTHGTGGTDGTAY